MEKTKRRGLITVSVLTAVLLAALAAAIFYYWKLQAKTPDTSGLLLVNAAWTGGMIR